MSVRSWNSAICSASWHTSSSGKHIFLLQFPNLLLNVKTKNSWKKQQKQSPPRWKMHICPGGLANLTTPELNSLTTNKKRKNRWQASGWFTPYVSAWKMQDPEAVPLVNLLCQAEPLRPFSLKVGQDRILTLRKPQASAVLLSESLIFKELCNCHAFWMFHIKAEKILISRQDNIHVWYNRCV